VYFLLLYREEFFTGKYTACEVHKELHCDTSGVFSLGVLGAKLTGQRSVGIPEENGTTFSD